MHLKISVLYTKLYILNECDKKIGYLPGLVQKDRSDSYPVRVS